MAAKRLILVATVFITMGAIDAIASPAYATPYLFYQASCSTNTNCFSYDTNPAAGPWGSGSSSDTVAAGYLSAYDTEWFPSHGEMLGLPTNLAGDFCADGASPGPLNDIGHPGNPYQLGASTGWNAPDPTDEQVTEQSALLFSGSAATTCGALGGTWESRSIAAIHIQAAQAPA